MKSSLLKDSIRQIKNTFKRFLSILLIVLLGVGFFSGIKATSPDMKNAVDKYYDDVNMMDIAVMSTLGITQEDVEELKNNISQIKEINPQYTFDAMVNSIKKDYVVKVISLDENMNKVTIVEGNMPQNYNECLVEPNFLIGTKTKIGDYIELKPEEMSLDSLNFDLDKEKELNPNMNQKRSPIKENKVKIVGTVNSPEYISRSRGSSKLGAGSVDYYMYMPKNNFEMDVYTKVYFTVNGAKELRCYKNRYKDNIEEVKDEIKTIAEDRKKIRYEKIVGEANKKLQYAENEYTNQEKRMKFEMENAQNQLNAAKMQLENGKKQLNDTINNANIRFREAENQIKDGEIKLNEGKKELEKNKKEVDGQLADGKKQLEELKKINAQYQNLKKQKIELEQRLRQINNELESLDKNSMNDMQRIKELVAERIKIEVALKTINSAINQIENGLRNQNIEPDRLPSVIAELESQINYANREIRNAENQINESSIMLENSKRDLENGKNQFNQEISKAKRDIENGEREIAINEQKLIIAKKQAQIKLEEAQKNLNEAKNKIGKIEKPSWYILDRDSNYGYVEYMQDTDRIANLAKVFPMVFFLVAALISLTSMSRMIEEQRVQIGTLKALGYNKIQISFKYIIYALLATILGSIIGMIIGFNMLPRLIYSMYAMMYTLPEINYEFRLDIGMIGLTFALICTVGSTIYTCYHELQEKPASLMLPRAPKPGKRIFLEKIKFIWHRMKFTQKVTARNIFRYKKKFMMTIIGVAGCTALIIAGFGIRDSITKMIPSQYGEIFKYNAVINLKDNLSNDQINEKIEKIKNEELIKDILPCYMKTVEITSIENSQSINLIAINDNNNLREFINLKKYNSNKEYELAKDKVIISKKIADLLRIKEEDKITIKDQENIEKEVIVDKISENYIGHYIYMTSDLYNNLYGKNSYKPNSILIKEKENVTIEEEDNLGKRILEDKLVISGISFLSNTKDIFNQVMDKMALVVYVLIVAAGLLAFAVLYNLSNVNISERTREIATLKVLGFNNKEVFNYITKETRILTCMGIIAGLFFGYFLTMFIIKTCELDMLMFDKQIKLMSFIFGIVITVVFAEIVNIAVNKSLKKINMADSLKSID